MRNQNIPRWLQDESSIESQFSAEGPESMNPGHGDGVSEKICSESESPASWIYILTDNKFFDSSFKLKVIETH